MRIRALWRDEDGQDLVEYSLLLAFIALAAIGLLQGASSSILHIFTTASTDMSTASTFAAS